MLPGQMRQPNFFWHGAQIVPSICFENLFPGVIAASLKRDAPQVIINASDMAIFDGTNAIGQTIQALRMLALSLQIPVVASSDTGPTALIDAHGAVDAILPFITQGVLPGMVRPRRGLTPYARWLRHTP